MYLKSYKELIVWQKSIILVKEIYLLTDKFPKSEMFALSSQMRRSAVSIPSNIAEGYSRKNLKEYIQFLRIACGSATEMETQIIISKELYPKLEYKNIYNLLEEILKMLKTIIDKLENKNN